MARCSVMVFAWRRRRYIYRDCFRIRKGGGKIRGCFEADEASNDASDELKLVKGGLMRVYPVHEERKNGLSLYFNRFIV